VRLAIMQPYFLPYLGYFQLINSVDHFVIADNLNFIRDHWVNRNRILLKGKDHLFTLKIAHPSSNRAFNETEVLDEPHNRAKLIKLFRSEYAKAPYFNIAMPFIERLVNNDEKNLSKYIEFSLRALSKYVGIRTNIGLLSDTYRNAALKGQAKAIDMIRAYGADEFINPIGGRMLYDKTVFARNNIKLSFLKTREISYKQFYNDFVPDLSIIDVMMFNPAEKIRSMLDEYDLV